MITDVIWHRLAGIRVCIAEAEQAYGTVDEPALIEAMEKVEELTNDVLRLARRTSTATGLRIVRHSGDPA